MCCILASLFYCRTFDVSILGWTRILCWSCFVVEASFFWPTLHFSSLNALSYKMLLQQTLGNIKSLLRAILWQAEICLRQWGHDLISDRKEEKEGDEMGIEGGRERERELEKKCPNAKGKLVNPTGWSVGLLDTYHVHIYGNILCLNNKVSIIQCSWKMNRQNLNSLSSWCISSQNFLARHGHGYFVSKLICWLCAGYLT